MAKKALPRKTTIRGQRHLLAYITPGEAELLKAHGGSGELHNGIPSYAPGFGSERAGFGSERAGGAAGGKSGAGPEKGGKPGGGKGASKPGGTGGKSTPGGAPSGPTKDAPKAKPSFFESLISIATTPVASFIAKPIAEFTQSQMQKVASQPGSTKIMSGGQMVGVRDQYGRLTGRDPFAERPQKDGESAGEAERKRKALLAQQQAAAGDATTGPSIKKKVIQTELAKETEASRLAGIKLGKRSLLSKASMLGV